MSTLKDIVRKGLGRIALVILGVCLTMVSADAQETGQLRFKFEPDRGMAYVIDGKYRVSDREITLQEGRHNFVFWAPERRMLDTSLFVVGGRTQDVLISLRYSVEYVQHRRDLERYERNKRNSVLFPGIVAAGTGIWFVASGINMVGANKDVQDLEDRYATLADPNSIQRLKNEQLPAARDELRIARNNFYISGALFAASFGTTLYMKARNKDRSAPEFKDTERIRFEGLVWLPGAGGGTWATGLSMPIR